MLDQQIAMNKQMAEISMRSREREEAWYMKRMDMEKELVLREASRREEATQPVKLQRYTITKFNGDFKDWLRFWNQFMVEIDGSKIPCISKFNYLLELVEGQPKDDILGLPHTIEGYEEAKQILRETYGKDTKVRKALIQDLENLHKITFTNKLSEVHEFYNKFSRIVRTLKTMKKLEFAESHVYSLLDKLGPVREVLTQNQDNWEEWKLEDLAENLRKYVERNPMQLTETNGNRRYGPSGNDHYKRREIQSDPYKKREIQASYGTSNSSSSNQNKCVYCGLSNHKSTNCMKILDIARRKDILKTNKLCFNCTKQGHMSSKCNSRGCRQCGLKHHTSICDTSRYHANQEQQNEDLKFKEKGMRAINTSSTTLHSTVLAKVNGKESRILFDSGSSSSYICTNLISALNLKPLKTERKVNNKGCADISCNHSIRDL